MKKKYKNNLIHDKVIQVGLHSPWTWSNCRVDFLWLNLVTKKAQTSLQVTENATKYINFFLVVYQEV